MPLTRLGRTRDTPALGDFARVVHTLQLNREASELIEEADGKLAADYPLWRFAWAVVRARKAQ